MSQIDAFNTLPEATQRAILILLGAASSDVACSALPTVGAATNSSYYVDPLARGTSLTGDVQGVPDSNSLPDSTSRDTQSDQASSESVPQRISPMANRSYAFLLGVNVSWTNDFLGQNFSPIQMAFGVTPETGEFFIATFTTSNLPGQSVGISPRAVAASVSAGVGTGNLSGLAGPSTNVSIPIRGTPFGVDASVNQSWASISTSVGIGSSNVLSITDTRIGSIEYYRPSIEQDILGWIGSGGGATAW